MTFSKLCYPFSKAYCCFCFKSCLLVADYQIVQEISCPVFSHRLGFVPKPHFHLIMAHLTYARKVIFFLVNSCIFIACSGNNCQLMKYSVLGLHCVNAVTTLLSQKTKFSCISFVWSRFSNIPQKNIPGGSQVSKAAKPTAITFPCLFIRKIIQAKQD